MEAIPESVFLTYSERGSWQCDISNSQAPRIDIFPLDFPREYQHVIDYKYAEYPPNCMLESLTLAGMNQMHKLGLKYRQYLIQSQHLINGIFNEDEVLIRATYEDVTKRSAISFLSGFFDSNDSSHIKEIITGTKNKEILVPNERYCNDVKSLVNEYKSSDFMKNLIKSSNQNLSTLSSYLGIEQITSNNLESVCEWLLSMNCNEQPLKLNVSESMIETCQKAFYSSRFGAFSYDENRIGVATSPIMREIFHYTDLFIKGMTNKKFFLFSGKSSTISAILSLLKIKQENILLASHISLYVLQKEHENYIKISLNGKYLQFPSNGETIISYHDFKNYTEKLINYCHELP